MWQQHTSIHCNTQSAGTPRPFCCMTKGHTHTSEYARDLIVCMSQSLSRICRQTQQIRWCWYWGNIHHKILIEKPGGAACGYKTLCSTLWHTLLEQPNDCMSVCNRLQHTRQQTATGSNRLQQTILHTKLQQTTPHCNTSCHRFGLSS